MEQNENQDSIRERIRAMPSTSTTSARKTAGTTRHRLPMLIQRRTMNDGTLRDVHGRTPASGKETARRTSVGIASKMPRSQLRYPQRNRHGRASARSAEGLAKP